MAVIVTVKIVTASLRLQSRITPRQTKGAQCLARLRHSVWVLISMRFSACSQAFSFKRRFTDVLYRSTEARRVRSDDL